MILKSDKGVSLRLVELNDAEFILKLRTDPELSQHISSTENSIEIQNKFLENYKEKEKQF